MKWEALLPDDPQYRKNIEDRRAQGPQGLPEDEHFLLGKGIQAMVEGDPNWRETGFKQEMEVSRDRLDQARRDSAVGRLPRNESEWNDYAARMPWAAPRAEFADFDQSINSLRSSRPPPAPAPPPAGPDFAAMREKLDALKRRPNNNKSHQFALSS